MAYLRQSDDETILVVLNFSKKEKMLTLPEGSWRVLFSENREGEFDESELLLLPNEAILLSNCVTLQV